MAASIALGCGDKALVYGLRPWRGGWQARFVTRTFLSASDSYLSARDSSVLGERKLAWPFPAQPRSLARSMPVERWDRIFRLASRMEPAPAMQLLLNEIRHLVFVPAVLVVETAVPHSHTLLFLLAVLAIVPLAALLSFATEAVATRTGDAVGGLLNATLGNLTELIIAITALRAGQYMLVKASIAGAIVTNALFMLGASLLLGGLRYHVQEYNRAGARLYSGLLLMATVALLTPSAVAGLDLAQGEAIMQRLSIGIAVLLIIAYGLGLFFSLKTHKELFASAEHEEREAHWPIGLAVGTLLAVTVLVTLVSEIFVESVQKAAETFGMSAAFVGFIVVSLVGAAAEFAVAFSAARKDRLDMSVSIALGSASQIALFVAPALVLLSYVVGPSPMSMQFWPGAVTMVMIATVTASFITSSGRSAWFIGALAYLHLYDLRVDALRCPADRSGDRVNPDLEPSYATRSMAQSRAATTQGVPIAYIRARLMRDRTIREAVTATTTRKPAPATAFTSTPSPNAAIEIVVKTVAAVAMGSRFIRRRPTSGF